MRKNNDDVKAATDNTSEIVKVSLVFNGKLYPLFRLNIRRAT